MENTTLRGVDNKELLSSMNKHIYDDRITFQEEGHRYWIDGDDTNLVSCTTYIHSFFDDVECDKIITKILNSYKWKNDKTYKYYMMSYDTIKESWDNVAKESSMLGTDMHALIEKFYNGIEVEFYEDQIEITQFLDFYDAHKDLEIYRTEWMIFSETLRITGSIDAVFMNRDGTLTLGDWKRSKQIKFNSFDKKMGKYPFDYLEDCNYTHYCLQLNLYRIILETCYGFTVKEMFLGVFHPENKDCKYIKIVVPRMDVEAQLLIDFRRDHLVKKT